MACAICEKPGYKNWNGGDPECGFRGPAFGDNWNCGTVNAIRDICGDGFDDERNQRVDYRWYDDQNYATILIDDIELPGGNADALWVSWYKRRGRTEAMWLLSHDEPPRLPTEADCVAIIAAITSSNRL